MKYTDSPKSHVGLYTHSRLQNGRNDVGNIYVRRPTYYTINSLNSHVHYTLNTNCLQKVFSLRRDGSWNVSGRGLPYWTRNVSVSVYVYYINLHEKVGLYISCPNFCNNFRNFGNFDYFSAIRCSYSSNPYFSTILFPIIPKYL